MAIKRKEGNTLVPVKAGYEAALNAKIDAVAEQVSNIDVTVSVGAGLDKDSDGNLILSSHADATTKYGQGSSDSFGHVKLTDDYTQAYTANSGIAATPKAIQKAIEEAGGSIGDITVDWTQHGNSSLGQVMSDGSLLITKSGTFTVPATGVYAVLAVGGGGNGGSVTRQNVSGTANMYYSGAGGGGAGGYVSLNLSLTAGETIQAVIGGAGGVTTFKTVLGQAGEHGGNGGIGTPGGLGGSGPLGYGGSGGGYYAEYIDGSPQGSDNYWKAAGGAGASSSFPIPGPGGGGGGTWGVQYSAAGGAAGAGYGGGGGGGGGGYTLSVSVGQTSAGGAGCQGAINILRIS